MKHELVHMRTQGGGAIVNCSSLGGLVGLPGQAAARQTSSAVTARHQRPNRAIGPGPSYVRGRHLVA
jgi:NAD(P)-dependent dehydrogenase (short-subunit alcohol dehydrogenase family)